MVLWDANGPWPEVWIVDPRGRMAPTLEAELSKRQVASRKVLNFDSLERDLPAGVIFTDSGEFASFTLGAVTAMTGRKNEDQSPPILWFTPEVNAEWIAASFDWIKKKWGCRGALKPVRVRSTTGPVLAKAIAYQLRKARP